MESTKTITKNSAKATRKRMNNVKRRLGRHLQKVNNSQPSQILKSKQTRKLDPIVARLLREKREQNQRNKAFYINTAHPLFNSNYNNLYQ